MSEANITSGLITTAKTSASFGNSDVTDADFSVLDQVGALDGAPYLIFQPSETPVGIQDTGGDTITTWQIRAWLYVAWEGWATSLLALRTARQAVFDVYNDTDGGRSPGSSGYAHLDEIRCTAIGFDFGSGLGEVDPDAEPLWLVQEMVFEVTEET